MTAISVLCLCVTVFVLRTYKQVHDTRVQRLEGRISQLELQRAAREAANSNIRNTFAN